MLAGAAVFASVTNGYYVFVLAEVALYAIVGIGLNILIGLTGQISFGHVGFFAIGAYAVAVLTTTFQWPFMAALAVAALVSGVAGAALAMPALRVTGPYLAMITIAFGFVVENIAVEWRSVTGGQNGIMGVPPVRAFGMTLDERGLAITTILIVALLLYGYWRLWGSNLGRAMRAVKDSEVAAESIGFNPVVVRTMAFALSAVCAGIAGGLFAPLFGFVTPSSFGFSRSLLFVLSVFIGGVGTVAGPLIGAAVVGLVPEVLAGMAEYRLLFFGVLLLAVLWITPDGIVGEALRLLRWKRAGMHALAASDGATRLPPSEPIGVKAEGLAIAFGGVKAVNNVSFVAPPGRITSLIGPNGAGKTTVLNLLSGIYVPNAGVIHIGRRALGGRPAYVIARAGVARTFQKSELFNSMTVFENLAIARGKGRLTASQRGEAELVARLASFVGYRGDLERKVADLAHVDRRLVEIARALATSPGVLLLDEPAGGLSGESRQEIARLLREIAASGVTLILVEHDMSLVMSISDHVVVVDAGVRIAVGPPRDIQHDPVVKKAYLGDESSRPVAQRKAAAALGEDLLTVDLLTAGYGAEPVLKGVSLNVRRNEMVAVLGANGSGKSTLMAALSGLHRPVEGRILLGGLELQKLPAHRVVAQGVVLVPEGHQVFPELSVLDNIRLGAFLHGTPEDAEIEAMLVRFPSLRKRLHQRAGLLSGGEQQMLAIARGLMSRPTLLLLDEPSLGLAPKVINELFAALDKLCAEKVTILLVDQMAALALALADRAYVIERGVVVASGTASDMAADDALRRAYLGGHAAH
ncbi:ATP-binding cassette domain-containing protein [Herbaspirillum sp. HC18]|nr:ATP-binding cassette domain-containing protein [Herbaspirillum sp. HC18]